MKKSILHSGKLFEFQRQQNYERHKQKIIQINRKKSPKSTLKPETSSPTYPSGYKLLQEYKVREQNNRLVQRIFSINKRKKFQILTSKEEYKNAIKFSKLHKKYSDVYRQQKERQLQEENQKIVEKLLQKRKKYRNKNEFYRDDNDYFILRKSRSKKKLSKYKDKNLSSSNIKLENNQSMVDEYLANKFNDDSERKRNHSTLLPSIEKARPINHTEILRILKDYEPYKQGKQNSELKNLQTNPEEKLDIFFSKTEQVQGKKIEQLQRQITKQSNISSQSPKLKRSYSTEEKHNLMSPELKFQKMSKRRHKKRMEMDVLKQDKDYENEQFEMVVDI